MTAYYSPSAGALTETAVYGDSRAIPDVDTAADGNPLDNVVTLAKTGSVITGFKAAGSAASSLTAHAAEHSRLTGRSVTAATTAVLADDQTILTITSASAAGVTIPDDATAGWVGNAKLAVYQAGAGAASFIAGANVTLHSPTGASAAAQYGLIYAVRVGANEWTLL